MKKAAWPTAPRIKTKWVLGGGRLRMNSEGWSGKRHIDLWGNVSAANVRPDIAPHVAVCNGLKEVALFAIFESVDGIPDFDSRSLETIELDINVLDSWYEAHLLFAILIMFSV